MMNNAVDLYIDELDENLQSIVIAVRKCILKTVPEIEERFSYKIPFYHYYGMFCYINPKKSSIDLGFCRGQDLLEAFPELESKNRKIVATVTIRSTKDVQQLNIAAMVSTAAIHQQTIALGKRKK
ncbi:MAG: DUF1801 domain-containing protein [Ferruginibacter sp.]